MGRTMPTECEHGYTVDGGDFASTEVCPICDGIDDPPPLKMTLRDQFAMAALQGLVRSGDQVVIKPCAEWCYQMADGMLEAREQ